MSSMTHNIFDWHQNGISYGWIAMELELMSESAMGQIRPKMTLQTMAAPGGKTDMC